MIKQFNFKSHKNMLAFKLFFMFLKTIYFIGGILRLLYGNVDGYLKHPSTYLVMLTTIG